MKPDIIFLCICNKIYPVDSYVKNKFLWQYQIIVNLITLQESYSRLHT